MGNEIRKAGACYYEWDANVTAIKRGAKRPGHTWKEYHTRRQTKEEARTLPWHKAGGVGIISGPGAWRCIDIDDCETFTVVQKILDALGIPHSYCWVVKSGSGRGWHIWIRCAGELPPGLLTAKSGEPGVLTGLPRNELAFDHLELRWERCQTVLPPSQHASGGRYQFLNGTPEGPPLDVAAKRLAKALRIVCRAPGQGSTPESKARQVNGHAERAYRNSELLKEEVRGMLRCIPARPGYPDWFKITAAVLHAVGGDMGAAEQLLKEWSPEEKEDEYRRILESNLDGSITTGTLVHYAKRHGYQLPRTDRSSRRNGRSHRRMNAREQSGAQGAQEPFTPSHLPRNRESVNEPAPSPKATPLFGFEKPAPLRWKVAGLIPEGHVSILAADGGTGKSFLSLYLALCICIGKAFFGLATRRGRVLYVDYELDVTEQQRRVWRVAEGMGMAVDNDRLQRRFFYFRPSAPLGTPDAHKQVMTLIERHAIDLTVLDSLTVGSAGSDVTASEDVVPVMQSLREWGTVFVIDHISGNAARGNQSRATPFGSVFKRNMARSTFTLAKADGGGYLLTPDKSNFTAKHDLVCYAVEFEGSDGPVRFEKVDTTDGRMAGSLPNMSSYDVTLTAIKKLADDDQPVTPEQIVKWRDEHDVDSIKAGTVRNHFTVLKGQGKIETKDGGALLVAHVFHSGTRVGNENSHPGVNGHGKGGEEQPADAFTPSRSLRRREGVNEDAKHTMDRAPAEPAGLQVRPRHSEDFPEEAWEDV